MKYYRNISFLVSFKDGAWQYEIPPNALFVGRTVVGGFVTDADAEREAKRLIDDWYM